MNPLGEAILETKSLILT